VNRVRVAIVGDYQPDHETHPATNAAIEHAAGSLGCAAETIWLPTPSVEEAPRQLAGFDGLIIAPGSPYQSMQGALEAARFARTEDVPLLATCGGFQHVILEYARNVLGFDGAQHAEYDPYASQLFITPLSCSLAGLSMDVEVVPDSRAAAAYGATTAMERYCCNFGLNPAFLPDIVAGGLAVSGVDQDGEVRIVELPALRFFLGTLFVPQMSSAPGQPHPLVEAFVKAASELNAS
jgi:CTP synthase (UTP-ammonia lyase)